MPAIAQLHDFWDSLPRPVRAELAQCGSERVLDSGGTLMRAGVLPDAVFQIRSGRVKYSDWDHQGHETVLTYMTGGDWVGLSEVFTRQPSCWNVVAVEPVRVRAIRQRDFERLVDRHPSLAKAILRLFALRFGLHRMFGLDHSRLSLKERLVKMLYFLSFGHGKDAADDQPIQIRLSQEELGKVVGASRQKLNPALRQLAHEGLLTVHFGALTLASRARISSRYPHLLGLGR